MLPSKTIIPLVFLCTVCHALDCVVNVTQGIPWTVGYESFNFAKMSVDTVDGLRTPLYPVDIDSNGNITSSVDWNRTSGNTSGSSVGYWQSLAADNSVQFGAIIGSPGVTATPAIESVDLDGSECSLGDPVIIQPAARTEASLSPVSVRDGKLYGTDGKPLALKGFNWFGLEVPGNSMLDGLWFGSDSISKDFATVVYRYQLLGFNAVRLPINFQNLYKLSPKRVTQSCNSNSQSTIVSSTKDPSSSAGISSAPSQRSPAAKTPGRCNSYLPEDSTINRFLAIVRFFAQNQFYILIDDHLNYDTTAIDDPDGWVQYWRRLAQSIKNDAVSAPWVMFDILNEPDSQDLLWEASGGKPGAGDLYLRAMDAIASVNPSQVMAIEGLGQTGFNLCWGTYIASHCNVKCIELNNQILSKLILLIIKEELGE